MHDSPEPHDDSTLPRGEVFEARTYINADLHDGEHVKFEVRLQPGERIETRDAVVLNYLSTHPHVRRIQE